MPDSVDHSKELIAWLLKEKFGARLSDEDRDAMVSDLDKNPDNFRGFVRSQMHGWCNFAAMDLGRAIGISNHDVFADDLIEALKKHFAEPASAS